MSENDSAISNIRNVFVLMLENRSFDHMLGFSGLSGTDPSGNNTTINGLTGSESNSYQNHPYPVTQPADYVMPVGPGHEFADVVEQLCGQDASYPAGATYPQGAEYPPIDNSGFVSDYAVSHTKGEGNAPGNFGEVMKCYQNVPQGPQQLPVLYSLASNFAVCDSWHASMPGPTWPNRFFAIAASSGGLDDSPSNLQIADWELNPWSGFQFAEGTLLDQLNALPAGTGWRVYRGDELPLIGAVAGVHHADTYPYSQFAEDLQAADYPWAFTFIEPSYGDIVFNTYWGGTSQHPVDNVINGEGLIKSTYEAIRNSPHWNDSLLIVTWDEHGGFYDHVAPPVAPEPGDPIVMGGKINRHGFNFDHFGVRVPAVVVSAYTPAQTIDHTLYDHSSIPATLQSLHGLGHLTGRDAKMENVLKLVMLGTARTDAPTQLPEPAVADIDASAIVTAAAASPTDSIDAGNLPGFIYLALRFHLDLSLPAEHPLIIARVRAIQTRADAAQYLDEVRTQVRVADAARMDVA
jgi:phospholipase C